MKKQYIKPNTRAINIVEDDILVGSDMRIYNEEVEEEPVEPSLKDKDYGIQW